MTNKTFQLKIFRGHPAKQYWEEFELERNPMANVISSLMEIQKNPVTKEGLKVTPISWEQGCLEEVCGSCTMLINGKPRQACTALIEEIIQQTGKTTITIAPLTKYPLARDLIVDRSIMFENLKKVRAWIDVDTTYDRGPGPKISQKKQEVMYILSTCMTCGCCTEACPQINESSPFIGPAAISQVRLFNEHPTGKMKKSERLKVMMEEGGINDCGNAQNCAKVCPKKIPLLESIGKIGLDVTWQAFHDFFGPPENE